MHWTKSLLQRAYSKSYYYRTVARIRLILQTLECEHHRDGAGVSKSSLRARCKHGAC